MIVDATSDFIFSSDVLSQTKFKPWWETIRGYMVAALYVTALMIIYLLDPKKSTVCLPIGNQTKEFDEIGSNNIHAFCSQEIPWFLKYLGYVSLGACVVIHAFYSWWLVIPRVAFTFRSLRKYENKCDQFDISAEDLWEQCQVELDAVSRKKLEKSLKELENEIKEFKPTIQMAVPTIYAVRNFIASIPVAFSIYALCILNGVTEEPFRCLVASITVDCTYGLIHQAEPFLKCMLALLVVIEIITLATFVAALAHGKKPTPFLKPIPRQKDYAFAMALGEHSNPISPKSDSVLKTNAIVNPTAQSSAITNNDNPANPENSENTDRTSLIRDTESLIRNV